MAIDVQIKCSDCGTLVEQRLRQNDAEIVCPECGRNMQNLEKDEYNRVARSLSGQRLCAAIAILFAIGVAVLLYLYVGDPRAWVSDNNPDYVAKLAKEGVQRSTDTSLFLYGAGACVLLCAIFGFFSARSRYVVEF